MLNNYRLGVPTRKFPVLSARQLARAMHAEAGSVCPNPGFARSTGQDPPQPSLASSLEETEEFESTLCQNRPE